MVDLVVMGGQAGGYSGGTQVVGRAPAMVTGGSVLVEPLSTLVRWTMPADPLAMQIGIYRASHLATPVFPGGSPYWVQGRSQNWRDHSPSARTTDYDYWVVTFDANGNPGTPTSANAAYIGHG